ncbi:MAG: cytochrome d ubiquinol oxidase subunit II [Alphaproteobacteria bacterium]|nr:cytochrome d ubiquinol oxidase subunit II [Alphaproteobacteria bacterium]
MDMFENGQWLPLVFAALMALAVYVYAVLDGYDLGVGILSRFASPQERDVMIASIGPFWDANETWLVLAVGLLLIAFPEANGIVLTSLYLPVALMLIGLILRGVSFDFRAKASLDHKGRWDAVFAAGSFLVAISQGYMVGSYILGFTHDWISLLFCLIVGLSVAFAYALVGASWLIMKTEGALQQKAIAWASLGLRGAVVGIVLVCLASPMVSAHVFSRWFTFPDILYLAPVPILTVVLVGWLEVVLRQLSLTPTCKCWAPFVMTASIFLTCLIGLAYSFYPYIVPGQLKIVDAASAPESLMFILVGALIVLPFMIGYTIFAYKVFHGKAKDLSYN